MRLAAEGALPAAITAVLTLPCGTSPALATRAPTVAPHVVVVLADDLGYSDLGSYGGEIPTPVLDRLARDGTRFTDFYVTPRCSPTRAALLTGRHPHEVGVGHLNLPWRAPAYRGELSPEVPTLPEVLAAAGYRRYMAGKWHLAHNPKPGDGPRPSWPRGRGFERFFGTLRGSGSYFEPSSLRANGDALEPDEGFYTTDALAGAASSFVEEHFQENPPGTPLFLYLAFTAPHWPLHARPRDLAGDGALYTRGWDVLRRERLARQRASGLAEAGWSLSPRPARVPAWSAVEAPAWQAQRMEVYAAMVEALDRGVGEVVSTLERHRALDDTLLLVLSDNGASAEEFRGIGRLARLLMPLPQGVRFGDDPEIPPGGPRTFQTVGAGWATLSNTPWRGFKHQTLEGGIASPLIVHWPRRLPGGGVVRTPAHVVDLLPTILDAAGVPYSPPGQTVGRSALAGRSLLPALLEGSTGAARPLFWEHEGNRGVRLGRYKLVSSWPRGWQLYDLALDRAELHDLASVRPELVTELAALYDAWARAVGVAAWPWVVPAVRVAVGLGLAALAAAAVVSFVFSSRLRPLSPPAPRPSSGARRGARDRRSRRGSGTG